MVDADEDSDTAHDAGPLPPVLVGLAQLVVEERVEKADDG